MEKELESTPTNNFNKLSEIIKTKYSYLSLKNIKWDSIVEANEKLINNDMSVFKEFEVYNKMLYTLKDGHVNLSSGFNYSRNWSWYLNEKPNFDNNIIERNYLGNDYEISGGLKHTTLDDMYAYVYYGSFSSGMSYIDYVKAKYNKEGIRGIIIDVRNNGGGSLKNAEDFASHFTHKKIIGYKQVYKIGKGENNFSAPYSTYIEPMGEEKWDKPIIILTNKQCYSATSFFITMMKELPNVTVIGDATGGGAGLPVDYTLPNGWQLRYSTTRCTDARGVDFELGVSPDIKVEQIDGDSAKGIDTLIEIAKLNL